MNQDKDFLGREPIGRLLLKLAFPTVAAQVINMLYNIVDRIYIGHISDIGAMALTGVGVCMPLIMIVSAFAALVAYGGAPRASIYMGQNNKEDALEELGSAENVEIVNGTTKMIGFVMMNMNEEYGGPVSNPDVQKAIRKALDYSGIRMICGDGTLTPYSIIQDGFMGSKGERSVDYTNIEDAKALLAEAGYPDGFDIDLTVCDLDMEGILLTDLAQKLRHRSYLKSQTFEKSGNRSHDSFSFFLTLVGYHIHLVRCCDSVDRPSFKVLSCLCKRHSMKVNCGECGF